MDKSAKRKRSNLLWLLVLLAVIAAWWFMRGREDRGVSDAQFEADRLAALGADPDDVLVDLRDDVSDADVAALEAELNIKLVLVSSQSLDERFYRAHVAPQRRDALIAALSRHSDVEIAEPDAIVQLSPMELEAVSEKPPVHMPEWQGYPNDPKFKNQWHMRQIHMPEAWKLADGEGVIVAVIDTGVAFENYGNMHLVPDLDGVEFVAPYNFVDDNKHAGDDHGHGTHVAGTIAQVTNNGIGVAGIGRKVKIMPLKVLSASGSGSVAAIGDAIRYAADNGAQVINMSLGGRFPSRIMKKAVKYAHDKGVTIVCAAGNDGSNKVGYPAGYPGAISVAATQYDENKAFYSNYGKDIDIAAPGGNTREKDADGNPMGVLQNTIAIGDPTHDDYYAFMGTSMASPHVAGVAALVIGEGVTDPKAVQAILEETARSPNGHKNDPKRYGAGIVDAEAAVLRARSDAGGWQLLIGLLIAGALASSVRRRGLLDVKLGPSYLVGVMIGSSGLFFLPRLSASLSSLPGVETLTRGLPSWDLGLLGPLGHGNALFFSALIPLGLLALLFGVRRMRAPLAGLAAGVAAHLIFHAVVRVTDIHYVPNTLMLDELWLGLNAMACVAIAHLSLRR